jgi:UDP:flavonoid glycosyltransferase YjiC (YdhE family)
MAGIRKRILFLPTLGFAHVTRTLVLAKELASEFEVRIAISRQFLSLAEELQIDTRLVDLPVVDYDKFARGEPVFDTEEKIERFAATYGGALDEFKPDGVVSSMPIAARIPIVARRIPHVTIFDACNHPQFHLPDELTKEQQRERIKRAGQMLGRFNAVAKRMNAPEEKSLRVFFTAALNVLPDLPSLFPIRALPPSFVYMGPVTWKGAGKRLDPTVAIDADKPLVYVTMGSSGNREHMKTIAERLRGSPFQVVITTGGVIDAQELKSYERPGFYVRDFLPGDKVIASSKQTIVICHGGIGTVYQALEHQARGILVLPAHWQHRRIGSRLAEIGLGRLVSDSDVPGVVEMVHPLLTAPHDTVPIDIGADLQSYPGAALGKKLIAEFLHRT